MGKEFGTTEGFILSSDCVGRFGDPREITRVWDFATTKEEKFLGIEVIGWKKVVNSLDKLIEGKLKVAGIHGRMGNSRRDSLKTKLRASFLDSNIANIDELLEKAHLSPYVLVHGASLEDPQVKNKVIQNAKLFRTFLVENHVNKGAMNDALKQAISLRERGVNAGIMIDVVHYFYENSLDAQKASFYWKGMLSALKKTIKEAKTSDPNMPVGIHLAVGTKKDDSLFMDGLSKGQWQRLAGVIHNEANVPVTLENQQEGVGLFFLTPEDALTQKNRNQKNFEVLVENGIIIL